MGREKERERKEGASFHPQYSVHFYTILRCYLAAIPRSSLDGAVLLVMAFLQGEEGDLGHST